MQLIKKGVLNMITKVGFSQSATNKQTNKQTNNAGLTKQRQHDPSFGMIRIDCTGTKHAITLTQLDSLVRQLPDFDSALLVSPDTKIAHTIEVISKKLNKYYLNMLQRPEKQCAIDVEQLQAGLAAEKRCIEEILQPVFGDKLTTDHNELSNIVTAINNVNFPNK